MHDGSYRPLDSSSIHFETDYGHFEGNNLVLDPNPTKEKVHIKLYLKTNRSLCKDVTIYIKKQEDPPLLNEQQVLQQGRNKRSKGNN